MADETLRLRADVIDKASPALKQIRKNLGEVQKTQGMDALGAQLRGLTEGVEGFAKAGSIGVGAMGALGLGALTASTSLVGLISHFKSLAAQTNTLRELSRETGLSVDQLNQLQQVAGRFGVGTDQMTKGLQNFYDAMIDVRRGNSKLASELNGQGLGTFVEKLKKDNPAEALHDMFAVLGSDKLMANPMLQKRWTEMVFGDGGLVPLFQNGSKGIEDAWADVAKTLDKINPDAIKNAQALQKAMSELNIQIANLENFVEPPIFKALADGAANTAAVIHAAIDAMRMLHRLVSAPHNVRYGYRTHGLYSAPQSPQEGADKMAGYVQERAELQNRLAEMRGKSRDTDMFDNLHRGDSDRVQELTNAIEQLTEQMKAGGGGAKPMSYNGGGFGALRRNVAFTAGTGMGLGANSPFEEVIEHGVLKALIEFANRGDLDNAAGGVQSAAFHPGGAGGDNSQIGRAFAGAGGGGPVDYSNLKGSAAKGEMADYIRKRAASLGIDPRIALAVAASEGLNNYVGDKGTSFGPYQLHYKNNIPGLSLGGLGDSFTKSTGLNARDPSTWRQQVDYALSYASRHGWAPWHGWRGPANAGIGAVPRVPFADDAGKGKMPAGTTWGKDSKGNPVAIGPDGQALGPDGKPTTLHTSSLNLLDLARDAGVISHRHTLEGGAHIQVSLNGDRGAVRGMSATTSGMVKSIALNRGSSMNPTLDA